MSPADAVPHVPASRAADSVPRAVRVFQVGYVLLAANFLLPAVSYVVSPATAVETMDRVNRALGGGAWPVAESSLLWQMLAVGNVMTLGFACVWLLWDLRRHYAALVPLVFLKMCSSLYSLGLGLVHGVPALLAVFVLDLMTSIALWALASRAHRALVAADGPGGGVTRA